MRNRKEDPFTDIEKIELYREYYKVPSSDNSIFQESNSCFKVDIYRNIKYGKTIRRKNIVAYVTKFDDEWFIVEFNNSDDERSEEVFYKCDQFDGLLSCLRNLDVLFSKSLEEKVNESINENTDQKTFKEIDKDTFYRKRKGDHFTDIELEKIESQFGAPEYSGFPPHTITINIINNIRLYIHKNDDEWFHVDSYNGIDDTFYECDQIDGLLDLMGFIEGRLTN